MTRPRLASRLRAGYYWHVCRGYSGAVERLPPVQAFERLKRDTGLKNDEMQTRVVADHLQALHVEMERYEPDQFNRKGGFAGFLSGLLGVGGRRPPKGLYLYGGVGCGKTMLMEMFYENAPGHVPKRLVHFNKFMLDLHDRIHKFNAKVAALSYEERQKIKDADPIPPVAKMMRSEASLLCIDEFQVTDIVDAMYIRRLFHSLMEEGVVVVATSNRPPEDLYKGGLNYNEFKPFVAELREHTHAIVLGSGKDYRRMARPSARVKKCYFWEEEDKNELVDILLHDEAKRIGRAASSLELEVKGRRFLVPSGAGGVAQFEFAHLCGDNVGAIDYLELTRYFHTIIVKNIPRMKKNMRNEGRRFINLVDVMYDAKVKLICTADVSPDNIFMSITEKTTDSVHMESAANRTLMDDLNIDSKSAEAISIFTGDDELFASQRVVSRLDHMGTLDYWEEGMNNLKSCESLR